ncbi:alpha/beta hydrolase [Bradyrhizobium sp. KB893862 SZCCT0404]|uniref:alpha/beta fold hydrolase n=1 Tax=Bradyrhizobium sp. KB893862 SZCCT0404 TaxID=2807672 RepID=UPI001BA8550D|nr:alpha/beta hydrolase family protein [Bradyrhizobium sp. KB893862 SZCCT0404]MBR1177018.1 alpha/beta hydrolase [Bradyrhizobium sp. KB893862 SZCCT0404]
MAAAAMIGAPKAQASAAKTFVLVHGAWHGTWCWRRVIDLLEAKGHKVFALTLTGLCERSHLLNDNINLTTHIMDVVNLMKWEDLQDVVLCGHSYGGYVISGAVEHIGSRVSSIVYLDAFLPENGDALVASSERVAAIIKNLQDGGKTSLPPIPAAVFQVNERDRAWVDKQCTPQPLKTFTDQIVLSGARERIGKKTYIRARGYASPPFDSVVNKLRDNPGWVKHELPCGHDAMLDMPEQVADLFIASA